MVPLLPEALLMSSIPCTGQQTQDLATTQHHRLPSLVWEEALPLSPAPAPQAERLTTLKNQITKLTNNQRAFPSLQPGPETPGCRSKLLGSPNQKLALRRQGPAKPGTWRSHLPCSQAQQPSGQAPHGQLDSRQANTGPARASWLREASEAMLPSSSGVTEPGLREEGKECIPSPRRAKSALDPRCLPCLTLSLGSAC